MLLKPIPLDPELAELLRKAKDACRCAGLRG